MSKDKYLGTFSPQMEAIVFSRYPSNLFRSARSFEFQLGNIRSRDVFRLIAYERKYLMDYNLNYTRSCRVASCSLHLRGK